MKKILDLTHVLKENIPTWTGVSGFDIKVAVDYKDCTTATKFKVQKICLNAGIGTHIDSPAHCFSGKTDISQIDINQLIVPIYFLDLSEKIKSADYYLTTEDILEFEKKFEIIKPNSLFIFYSGWSKYWDDPKLYRNLGQDNIKHFPGISKEAANLLLKRDVAGIAIDTLSADGSDLNYPVHNIILGQNKYLIENIANCKDLTPVGFTAIIAPLKVKDATESSARIFAVKEF